MTKRKHKIHKYEEGEIVYKQWFLSKPFIDKFLPTGLDTHETIRFSRRIGLDINRIRVLSESDNYISANTADKYAIRMRIPPIQYMARLV